jgi:hypothetical protein
MGAIVHHVHWAIKLTDGVLGRKVLVFDSVDTSHHEVSRGIEVEFIALGVEYDITHSRVSIHGRQWQW